MPRGLQEEVQLLQWQKIEGEAIAFSGKEEQLKGLIKQSGMKVLDAGIYLGRSQWEYTWCALRGQFGRWSPQIRMCIRTLLVTFIVLNHPHSPPRRSTRVTLSGLS